MSVTIEKKIIAENGNYRVEYDLNIKEITVFDKETKEIIFSEKQANALSIYEVLGEAIMAEERERCKD